LCEILAFALRTLYSIKKSKLSFGLVGENWRQRTVAELDSAMNEWISSLPEHLRSESATRGEGIFAQQSAFLHGAFSNLQILIHRPQIHRTNSSLALPSLVICMNAARSCANVLDCQKNTGVTSLPHAQYWAFVACGTLLSVDSRRDLDNIEKLMNILKARESRFAGAGRFIDLLTELKRRYKHPESEPAGDTSLLNLGPNAPQNPASTSGPDSTFVVDENTEILLQQIFGSGSNQDVGVMDTDGQLPHDLSILGAAPSNFNYYEWVG